MAVDISVARAQAMLDNFGVAMDSGATLRFYASAASPPANIAAAVVGSEVCRCPLNTDAFAAATDETTSVQIAMNTGTAVEDTDADGSANAIDYYRVYASDGTTGIIQGTVTASGGGGDIEISSTTIANGEALEINSWTLDLALVGS